MLSWITGPRGNDGAALDTTSCEPSILEPPETPAHLFAVNAFKHALFGTPAPEETARKASAYQSTLNQPPSPPRDRPQQSRLRDHSSPTKPVSILMTPGAINGRRKNVTFGTGVQNNEGKRPSQSSKKAALPDFPGTFPSPATPKEKTMPDKKPLEGLTASRHNAGAIEQAGRKSQLTQRAKDDSDITLDVLEPRSQSGRYWKEVHEAYATKSEKETRKLIAKHKLAKDFAKKKDAEAAEARLKLEAERKKHRGREKSWETSMKDIQERLRKAVADNAKYAAELALMRQQLELGAAVDDTSPSDSTAQQRAKVSENQAFRLLDAKADVSQLRMSSSPLPSATTSPGKAAPIGSSVAPSSATADTLIAAIDQSLAIVSSDPIPTPTPSAAHTKAEQGSRAYHVSSRPVTVMTAHVKGMQPVNTPPRSGRRPRAGVSKSSQHVAVAEDSDLDLWAISNLDLLSNDDPPHLKGDLNPQIPRQPAVPSTRPTVERPVAAPDVAKSLTSVSEPNEMGNAAQMPHARGPKSHELHNNTQNELGHFPGSPRLRKPLAPSLANSRTALPLSREEQARQRVLARRAKRKTKDELQEKENMGAVLSTLLGS